MKKISMLLLTVLLCVMLTPVSAAAAGENAPGAKSSFDGLEFVPSPSRGEDSDQELSELSETEPTVRMEEDAPASPQTGEETIPAALPAAVLGCGAAGMLLLGRKREKGR